MSTDSGYWTGGGVVMLKEFRFRNCYSFRDETLFSMSANYGMKDNINSVIDVDGGDGKVDRVVSVAAVYGSNAGGKTNFVKALFDMAYNVCVRVNSIEAKFTGHFRNSPALLSKKPEQGFYHGLVLLVDGKECHYSYVATNNELLEERLDMRPIGSKEPIENVFLRRFVDGIRDEGDGDVNTPEARELFKSVKQDNTSLFMSLAGSVVGIEPYASIYRWCESVVYSSQLSMRDDSDREAFFDGLADALSKDENRRGGLRSFINKLDPSVSDVCALRKRNEEDVSGVKNDNLKHGLYTIHSTNDGGGWVFRMGMESAGTQKLFELYPYISDALKNGAPLICDELDARLHPIVFRRVVELFNDPKMNTHSAQLIFTAHNTMIMNREELRRDEIYIIDKDNYGASSIGRLCDYVDENGAKIRSDARYDNIYLSGVLGGIPNTFWDASVI